MAVCPRPMTTTKLTAEEIVNRLYNSTFRFSDEKSLQQGIGIVLENCGCAFKREAVLTSTERIDFLVEDGIGIEVKSEHMALNALQRQLKRYAMLAAIKELILVTTKNTHLRLPKELNGKPLHHVYLLHSFL
jgi:hypothetical protein